jgi:chaperonin GroES
MEKEMKLRPLLDKVVLKEVEAVETTSAGILLPGSAKEKPQISEIVAVGPGGIVNGERVEMTLKTGDRVITAKYTGTQVKLDGVEYTIVSASDILAVVE